MPKETKILNVLSDIEKDQLPGFVNKKALINEDGNEKVITFCIEEERKTNLHLIKPGFKFYGNDWTKSDNL